MSREGGRHFPNIQVNQTTWHFLLFTMMFLGLCVYYTYPVIFDYAPQSTHAWRQTDGASIAYSYYQNGMHFFEPQILNLLDSNGNTIGEFPLLYYLTAGMSLLFGYHDGWMRVINLLFLFAGLFALSRLAFQLLGDLFSALFIPFILMTSPVLTYYGFNYLPDVMALGLAFIAASCFNYYYNTRRNRWLVLGLFLFLLAGLTKITILFGLIALLSLHVLSISTRWGSKIRLPGKYKVPGGTLIVLAIVFAWVIWMKEYKESHASQYFLASTNAIWAYSPEVIRGVFERIWTKWMPSYFHPLTILTFVGLGLFTLVTPKRQHVITYALNALVFLGSASIFVLWFYQFHHHDYYLIILLVLPASILINFALYLKKNRPGILKSRWLRLLMIALFILGTYHARQEIDFRYTPGNKYMAGLNPSFLKRAALLDFLEEKQIQYPDKVVSLPDGSPNTTLYYLRLKGWTNFNSFSDWKDERGVKWNRATFAHLARLGCKYLVISDDNWLNNPDLQEVQQYPVGVFDDAVYFFDIRYLAAD